MTNDDITRLKEAAEKATPGPWEWFGTHKAPYLATNHSGRLYVMSFARSGTNGAQPVFRSHTGESALLKKGEELAIFAVNKQAVSADDPSVYRKDIVGFRSPDATWIALANPTAILSLLQRLREAEEAALELAVLASQIGLAASCHANVAAALPALGEKVDAVYAHMEKHHER